MGFIVEVQTQVLMVNYEYYIVCRFDDGRQNDLKNYQTIKIFSMFSSVLLAIFSVCVLELDFFASSVGPAYFTSGKCLLKIRSEFCYRLQYVHVHE
jgi:hypothetical protein